ncbi:MAG: response regulator transcription factor [Terriglobales bacterium]
MITSHKIRLVIADPQDVVLAGLKLLISRQRHLDCVGCAVSSSDVLGLASRLRADVIVMDIPMLPSDGLDAMRRLAKLTPETRVLSFSMRPAASMVLAALRAGASGYVSKASPSKVLIEAISVVAKGKRFIDPELADPMLQSFLDEPKIGAEPPLTQREREVLLAVAYGFTNNFIGADLGLSTKTIEGYRSRACEKLALVDRPAIVKFALMSGWMKEQAG